MGIHGKALVSCVLIALLAGVAFGQAGLATPPESGDGFPSGAPEPLNPAALADALDVSFVEVQQLALPNAPIGDVAVAVTLGGHPVVLALAPHSVRAPGFRVRVQGADGGLTDVLPPAPATYAGHVLGVPGSRVVAVLHGGRLTATIDLSAGAGRWAIQPADGIDATRAPAEHLVYAANDVLEVARSCGVTAGEFSALAEGHPTDHGHPNDGETHNLAIGSVDICQIAFDVDHEYYKKLGSSVNAAVADVESILHLVSNLYVAQTGIQYVLTEVIVRADENDPYFSSDSSILLGEMLSHWNASQGGVTRDIAHLFTGKEVDGNVIGRAYVGVICIKSFGYGFSQSRFVSNLLLRLELTKHELGHNWSSPHCDGDSDCGTMCSAVSSCGGDGLKFGNRALTSVSQHRASAGCLDPSFPIAKVDAADFLPLGAFNSWRLADGGGGKRPPVTLRSTPFASPDSARRYRIGLPDLSGKRTATRIVVSEEDGTLFLHRMTFNRKAFTSGINLPVLTFDPPLAIGAPGTNLDVASVASQLFEGAGDGINLRTTVVSAFASLTDGVDSPLGMFETGDLVDWSLSAVMEAETPVGGVIERRVLRVDVCLARGIGPVRLAGGTGGPFVLDAAILRDEVLGPQDPTTGQALSEVDFDLPGVFTVNGAADAGVLSEDIDLDGVSLQQGLDGKLLMEGDAAIFVAPFGTYPITLKGAGRIKAKTGEMKAKLKGKLAIPGVKPLTFKSSATLGPDSEALAIDYKRAKEVAGTLELGVTPAAGPGVALVFEPLRDAKHKQGAARTLGAEGTLTIGAASFPVVVVEKRRTKKKDGSLQHAFVVFEHGSKRKVLALKGQTLEGGELELIRISGKLVGLPVKLDPSAVELETSLVE